MGVQKRYNSCTKKWELKGFMFVMEFETEEECDAHRREAWEKHMRKITAWNMVAEAFTAMR